MKIIIDWFFDDDMLLHLIYINGKQFRYGGVADFEANKMVCNIQEFCAAVGIELEIIRHDWCYSTNPDPMELSDKLELDITSGW